MTTIQFKRGTTNSLKDVVLAVGELALNLDDKTFKIGDGVKKYSALDYANSGALTPTQYPLTIATSITGTGSTATFNGSAPLTIDLPATISRNITGNSGTATVLQNARSINGASFDGSSNIVLGGAIYGSSASTSATFRNIFVSQTEPTGVQNGDVWISW
jgi:hypothetical protein